MTTGPSRAAEIVVASKEARSAAADLYLAQQGEPHSPHDLATAEAIRSGLNDHWEVVQAFARFERDHMQRPTDTARAVDELASYEKFDGVGPHAETIETRARIGERYLECYESALSDPRLKGYTPADCPSELLLYILHTWEPATPSPVTDETALSREAKARQLLAATINRKVFPGKAEHLLSGKDDLLFDARPALDAIIAALASTPQPAAAETVAWQTIDTAPKDGTKFLAVDAEDGDPFICRWEADLYAPNGGRGGPAGWFSDNWMDRWGDSPITEFPIFWAPFPAFRKGEAAVIRQSAKGGE